MRTLQCFQKKIFFFFAHKKLKKPPSKVAHNRPKHFIPQPSPSHSQQPKIDFSCYKNVPPSVCSLVCDLQHNDLLENRKIFTRRYSSQLFENFSWMPPWSWGKHSCLSPRDPRFESTFKSSKKWTQKLSVQFNYFMLFLYVYITNDDIKEPKVQSNLSKITIQFWTVCTELEKQYTLLSNFLNCNKINPPF